MHSAPFRARTRALPWLSVLLVLAALLPALAAPQWEMRLPWKPDPGFIRSWLVCGEFPVIFPDGPVTVPRHPGPGLTTDYLGEQGGESAIRPVAGMTHTRPDGTKVAWQPYQSPGEAVDFLRAFAGRPTMNVVGYAYTTIPSDRAKKAILSVGSDDSVRIWLNGTLVHHNPAGRALVNDSDAVEVSLQPGDNALLVKVDTGSGGWGFSLRVLAYEQAAARARDTFYPSLVGFPSADNPRLTILSDSAAALTGADRPMVEISIVSPTGTAIATQQVPKGEKAVFDASRWPDGAYEIRGRLQRMDGTPAYAHLFWYKGDAVVAAHQVIAAARKLDPDTQDGMVCALLAEALAERTAGLGDDPSPAQAGRLYLPLMEFARLQARPRVQRGFVRLAYRDEVDGSAQYCRVYLPEGYTPEKRWPVVIYLHGYSQRNPRHGGIDQLADGLADRHGVITIYPHGRGNVSYRGIGERDVLRTLAMAKQTLSIDPNRVYLTGFSMGGAGAWWVGARHPGLFAAVAPMAGGWDYHAAMTTEEIAALTPCDRYWRERDSTYQQIEQLLTTPVWVHHGENDGTVKVDNDRYAVQTMQRWGYDIRYTEYAGKGHQDFGTLDTIVDWFLTKQYTSPARVRVRAYDLPGAAAHWVRVEQSDDPYAPIAADVEVVGPNTISLDSSNVLQIALAPGAGLVDPAKPLTVVWNTVDVRTVPMVNGAVTLSAKGYRPTGLVKRPTLAQPGESLAFSPMLYVIGTISPDPLMRRHCERIGEAMRQDWEDDQRVTPRVKRDTEVTEADQRAYSLVLIGGPDANLVTKRLADRLPLTIAADAVTIDGHVVPARDAAVRFCYPNPDNAERTVLVLAATSARGMYWVRRLPDNVDFAVYDGRIADRAAGITEAQVLPIAGFFNHHWRYEARLADDADPAVRARYGVRNTPQVVAVPAVAALPLSALVEARTFGSFRYMERGLNARAEPMVLAGKTYTDGLAAAIWNQPCAVEYDTVGLTHLRATLGIELSPKATEQEKADTRIRFIVRGDGRELFRSEPFGPDTPPQPLSVDITGVKTLRLEVANDGGKRSAALSADWADARLER